MNVPSDLSDFGDLPSPAALSATPPFVPGRIRLVVQSPVNSPASLNGSLYSDPSPTVPELTLEQSRAEGVEPSYTRDDMVPPDTISPISTGTDESNPFAMAPGEMTPRMRALIFGAGKSPKPKQKSRRRKEQPPPRRERRRPSPERRRRDPPLPLFDKGPREIPDSPRSPRPGQPSSPRTIPSTASRRPPRPRPPEASKASDGNVCLDDLLHKIERSGWRVQLLDLKSEIANKRTTISSLNVKLHSEKKKAKQLNTLNLILKQKNASLVNDAQAKQREIERLEIERAHDKKTLESLQRQLKAVKLQVDVGGDEAHHEGHRPPARPPEEPGGRSSRRKKRRKEKSVKALIEENRQLMSTLSSLKGSMHGAMSQLHKDVTKRDKEVSDWQQKNEKLHSENEDLRRHVFCSICVDTQKDRVLVPCGHMYCSQCAHLYMKCPLCRMPVKKIVPVFTN